MTKTKRKFNGVATLFVRNRLWVLAACTASLQLASAAVIMVDDFEAYETGDGPADTSWSQNSSNLDFTIVDTVDSGEYVGGLAARVNNLGQTYIGGYETSDATGITGFRFDVKPTLATAGNLVMGGTSNPGSSTTNGSFTGFEAGISSVTGNDNTSFFQIRERATDTYLSTGTSYLANNWYQITVEFDYTGTDDNAVNMSVRNLTAESDVSLTTSSWELTNAEFGDDPSDWTGVAARITRGDMDNVAVIPEPGTAVLLAIGMLGLLFARRRK